MMAKASRGAITLKYRTNDIKSRFAEKKCNIQQWQMATETSQVDNFQYVAAKYSWIKMMLWRNDVHVTMTDLIIKSN